MRREMWRKRGVGFVRWRSRIAVLNDLGFGLPRGTAKSVLLDTSPGNLHTLEDYAYAAIVPMGIQGHEKGSGSISVSH
jgi:hypothetical protein